MPPKMYSLEKRVILCNKLRAKYPDYIPVIIECIPPHLQLMKNKFLIPKTANVGALLLQIHHNIINLNEQQAVFLFCGKNGMLVSLGANMEWLYFNHKNTDGFLYMQLDVEKTFG